MFDHDVENGLKALESLKFRLVSCEETLKKALWDAEEQKTRIRKLLEFIRIEGMKDRLDAFLEIESEEVEA